MYQKRRLLPSCPRTHSTNPGKNPVLFNCLGFLKLFKENQPQDLEKNQKQFHQNQHTTQIETCIPLTNNYARICV